MSTNGLILGNTYNVKSTRKGKFQGVLTFACDTWATFKITQGKASAMLPENERDEGEEVTVRRSFCEFSEVQQ